MNTLRTIILFGTLGVFLYFINTGIWQSEKNIREGTVAYLELAPVDPRSLIQGDYMILRYNIEGDARIQTDYLDLERLDQFVVTLDDNAVVQFERAYTDVGVLADDEILINYAYTQSGGVRVGIDSFFFQEGQAEAFENARYAEIRILAGGGISLVNLTDENFVPINPE